MKAMIFRHLYLLVLVLFIYCHASPSIACSYVLLGNNKAVVSLANKQKIFVDTNDIKVAPHLMLECDWEPWKWIVLEQLITPKSFILEIGTNFGVNSVKLASRLSKEGKLFIFEPSLSAFRLVEQTIATNSLNHNVFFLNKSLLEQNIYSTLPVNNRTKIYTAAIQELVRKNYVIDLLSIDVPGDECNVLYGIQQLITKSEVTNILMKWDKEAQIDLSSDPKKCLHHIENLGLLIFKIFDDSSLQQINSSDLLEDQNTYNILLTRRIDKLGKLTIKNK